MTKAAVKADGKRDGAGRFGTGNTLGKGGRPCMPPKVRAAFQIEAQKSLPALAKMASRIKPYTDISHTDQLKALSMILDRAWGKPEQAMEVAVTERSAGISGAPMDVASWRAMVNGKDTPASANGSGANGG